ncbi:MAG: phosphomethylpyrimidine synthase ThiC [Planctomycetota bacterium]
MTQLEAARQTDEPTPQMIQAAESEPVDAEAIRQQVARGRAVVLTSGVAPPDRPCAVGAGLRTKVNANIGTSLDYPHVERELRKLRAAEEAGADTVMDLSTGGDIPDIRRQVLEHAHVPVGSVPIYSAAAKARDEGRRVVDMTADDIIGAVREHMADGISFVTIHCGVTREVVRTLRAGRRVCGIVSRGGTFVERWMAHTGQENPLYERYDELIDMAREHDVTFSLGDGLRPGCLADSMDRAQVHELMVLGELRDRATAAGVQVMIEGPGHVPIDQIEAQVAMEKELCGGAPFYVLGPIVTDVAPGYDHITSAVGGSIAAAAGADFLCYVTPSEHLSLPDEEQVRQGVMAARIAAHAGDVGKGIPGAADWDRRLSALRRRRDWEGQLAHCLDPAMARRVREHGRPADEDVCSMCGEYCVFKLADEDMEESGSSDR